MIRMTFDYVISTQSSCHTDYLLQCWSEVFIFSILPKCLLLSLCMHISLMFHLKSVWSVHHNDSWASASPSCNAHLKPVAFITIPGGRSLHPVKNRRVLKRLIVDQNFSFIFYWANCTLKKLPYFLLLPYFSICACNKKNYLPIIFTYPLYFTYWSIYTLNKTSPFFIPHYFLNLHL